MLVLFRRSAASARGNGFYQLLYRRRRHQQKLRLRLLGLLNHRKLLRFPILRRDSTLRGEVERGQTNRRQPRQVLRSSSNLFHQE